MSEVELRWTHKLQFVGTDSTQHAIVLSSANGENRTGVKPSDLLLLALAGCTGVDVVEILQKKRQPLRALTVRVSGEQDADPPWAFRRIHLVYEVHGAGLAAKAVEQAVTLSQDKYCSVRASLANVEFTREVHILEE